MSVDFSGAYLLETDFATLALRRGTAFVVLLVGWLVCPLVACTPLLPVALVAYRVSDRVLTRWAAPHLNAFAAALLLAAVTALILLAMIRQQSTTGGSGEV